MHDYHAIFSAESNLYQKWQSILLTYTHKQVQQPGSLICLLSGREDPGFLDGHNHCQIIPSRLVSYNPVTKDHYVCYNRETAILDYLSKTTPGDRVYLILDPDMVFTKPWTPTLDTSEEVGELTWYMDPNQEPGRSVIRRYARKNPSHVQSVGWPVAMRESALRAVMDRWHLLTETLRGDPWSREKVNWVTDMWSFSIACAECGVRFRLERNASFPGDEETDRSLVHYTYATESRSGYRWDKRCYTAWDPLPPLKPDVPAAGKQLHKILNTFLKDRKNI
jgi:hypothetical protein